ncbi:hypothetical protein [Streptomyces sp. NPDC047315]
MLGVAETEEASLLRVSVDELHPPLTWVAEQLERVLGYPDSRTPRFRAWVRLA